MFRSRVARMTVTCAMSGVLAVAASGWASAASTGSWQLAYQHGTKLTYTGYRSVAVSGGQAWAVGTFGVAGDGLPAGAHRQNGQWTATPMPIHSCDYLAAVSADAPGDAWATGIGCVLHWHSGKWTVSRKWTITAPPAQPMTGIIAFSPTNVWTFGDGWKARPGLGTWHLHGGTWTRLSGVGANITTASAVSPASIWAIGGIKAERDAILHYANGSWHQVTGAALAGLRFNGIFAASASSLWVTATTTAKPATSVLLHLLNGRWTSYPVPVAFSSPPYSSDGQIAADGRGGLWITESAPLGSGRLLYFSSTHTWAIAATGGNALQVARVSGTTSLWASGVSAWSGHAPYTVGTIWRHG